jgi:hypothetical protein
MKKLLLVATLLLVAGPAWAADGDRLDAVNRGSYRMERFLLCDGATGGPTKTCDELSFGPTPATGGVNTNMGIPDYIVFHITNTAGCGAVEFMPRGKDVAGGATSDLLAATMTAAGTDQAVVSPVPNAIIDANITVGAGCTDAELTIKLFYERDLL